MSGDRESGDRESGDRESGERVDPGELDGAARALEAGLVVAIPTDTVYGLAADPRRPGAAERLFSLKRRPQRVAMPVLIADPAELWSLAEVPVAAERLVGRYWPGPLTLVLARLGSVAFDLGGDPATIGVRCPASAPVRDLLRRTGPIAVTSANAHGEPPLHTAAAVREHFGDEVALVVDGGRCAGEPSTVVSVTTGSPVCLRAGSVPFEAVLAAAGGAGGRPPSSGREPGGR